MQITVLYSACRAGRLLPETSNFFVDFVITDDDKFLTLRCWTAVTSLLQLSRLQSSASASFVV